MLDYPLTLYSYTQYVYHVEDRMHELDIHELTVTDCQQHLNICVYIVYLQFKESYAAQNSIWIWFCMLRLLKAV